MKTSTLLKTMALMVGLMLFIPSAFAQFNENNLAILVAAASTNNTTVSVVEINKVDESQTAIQTISIPGTGSDAIRVSGSATSTLYAANSEDRTLFCFTGHYSDVTGVNANTILPRAVVTINNNGAITIATTYTGTSGNQTRCATTIDNVNFYIADQAGQYTNNSTSASPTGNFRGIKVFGGTVYVGRASNTAGVEEVATTSALIGGSITGLNGLTNFISHQDFYLISSGENGENFDILYIVRATSNTAGTIAKYSLVAGTWVANGTFTTTFGGFSLAAEKSGTGASLYVSTGLGALTANSVRKLTDAAGYNQTINITNNIVLFTTATGTIIKGVAFAPISSSSTPVVATPIFNPPAGNYYAAQNVTITTSTEGATIYYTTDGSDPDENSSIYTDPIAISSTTTLKARAYKDGYDPSNIATALYNFPPINNVADIATLRAGTADGVTGYKLTGEAILTAKDAFNNRKFLEDETAAIMIFDQAGIITGTYNLGDGLQNITGTLTIVNNMLRFVPVLNAPPASSTGNPLIPTIFEIDELTSADQAKLVRLENVSFTTTGTFANGQNYTITDGINNMVLRTDFWDVDYIGQSIPTVAQNITGVIIQFNDVIQIVPRFLADFEEAVFDVDPPQAFNATTVDSDEINLTFTTNPANNDIVIVYNGTGTFSDPSGTPPAIGEAFAGGLLLYVGKTSPVAHTGLNAATQYFYKAWSFDGANYSPGLTANATTLASEPNEHATEFLASTNSSSSITVTWKDFDAEAYLVKASSIGYNSISAPVDGVPEADGTLVKNVAAGIEEVEFTGLAASTEYFFKIFPYNGSGALINYKTDGEVPQTSATTDVGPAVPVVFTMWDFDENPLQPSATSPAPVIGTGVASIVGSMSSPGRQTGTISGCTQDGVGAWHFGSAAPGTNESSGAQFMVPTTGYENIVFEYDHRFSNTATRTARIQYTLNGTTWLNLDVTGSNYTSGCAGRGGIDLGRIDIGDPVGTNVSDGWSRRTIDFSGIPEANNNPNFGIRIVAAHYANTGEFRQANNVSAIATAGTWRFDNVTFSGFVLPPAEPTKLAITDVNGGLPPSVNVPFEVTVQSQDEDGIPANVTEDTEVTLTLATGTGTLGGTLVGTILSGQNSVIFNNVTYDTGEPGVSITATTTDGMVLTPATSAVFEVLSPATQLAFVGFPSSANAGEVVSTFTVEARRPNNTVDPNFTGNIILSKQSGPGNVSGTLTVAAVNGIATFNNVVFSDPGQYTLAADATGLTQAISSTITINAPPAIVGLIMPHFMSADNPTNNRVPYAFRVRFLNLLPNSTYKYINQVVISSDGPTVNGAGNSIFVTETGDFIRTTSPSFTSSTAHYEFTTNSEGSCDVWMITEPTTNARFTPGNEVYMRVRINDGAGGTTAVTFLTVNDPVKVLGFATEAGENNGTAVRAISAATPKNFAFIYSNTAGTGRPLFGTSIETTGIDFSAISNYAAFYRNDVSGVDGAWGGIIPNDNANGVRRIEERSKADGSLVNTHTSDDGMWGATNTVNPTGGTTALLIDLTIPEVPENRNVTGVTLGALDVECYDATNNITVTNTTIGNGASAEFRAGVNIIFGDGFIAEEGSYMLAIITDVYCTLPPAMLASEEVIVPQNQAGVLEAETSFKVYPNPTSGDFTLELNGFDLSSKISVEIYNMMGERLLQQEIFGSQAYRFDMSQMPKGMYILRLLNGDKAEMQKIIKQ